MTPNVSDSYEINSVHLSRQDAETLWKLVPDSNELGLHSAVHTALRMIARQLRNAEPVANRIPAECT